MKKSMYNITQQSKKNTILYNTSNANCVIFSNENYNDYLNCSLYKEEFFKQGFYVEDDKNEFKFIVEKSNLIINQNDFLKLRILTTTNCNAKCHYCYEKGIFSMNMNKDVAIALIDFIKNNFDSNKKYLEIEWFGGEPLLNINVIDFISTNLHKMNINYFSTMVSNGFLIDDTIIDKMNSLWKLKKIQITLDGRKSEYEKIKKLGEGSYEKIISTIKKLSEHNIKVDIRLNFNKENLNEINSLINELGTYKFNNFVEIYIAKIFDYNTTDLFTLEDEMIILYNSLHKANLLNKLKLLPKTLETGCMAYYPNFYTIDPNGKLFKCDRRLLDKNSIATVFNYNNTKTLLNQKIDYPVKCEHCSIFPTCWGGCLYDRINSVNTCYMTERIYKSRLSMMLNDFEDVK